MEMIDLEKLRTIKSLNDIPTTMTHSQKMSIGDEIDKFIENLPNNSFEMIKLLDANDYSFLEAKLKEMQASLKRMYAKSVARNCSALVDFVKNKAEKSKIDIHLEKLISELNTLSVDIQALVYKSQENHKNIEYVKHSTQGKKNILAVDDDPVILNILRKIIDGEKYEFSGTASGKTAVQYLEAHSPPDLVILDIEMPEMDGYELAEIILRKDNTMPIIFLTSNATREHIMKAMQTGAIDFLVKPVNEELIIVKLDKYLE